MKFRDRLRISIPDDIVTGLILTRMLAPSDLINKVQFLSRYWRDKLLTEHLWKLVIRHQKPLPPAHRFRLLRIIVERRSKGRLCFV